MSTMAETQKQVRRPLRKHTAEFKARAVRLILDEGRRCAEVARDLDLSHSLLSGWVRQARIDAGQGPPGALTTVEREELGRLRKENRTLKMERELLKKWAAFFAKENA